jgi:hypothetical protein
MPFRDVGSLTAGNRVLVIVLVLVSCLGVALGMSFHVVSMFDQYARRVEVVPVGHHGFC